jgi:hypothetical protein
MILRRFLVLPLLVVLLAVMSSCGGGGSAPKFAPPPTGGFSNASLNGTYAVLFTANNQFGFFGLAGSFQADGNGNITTGIADINSGGGVFTNVAISGTYKIGADGRGTAALITSVNPITIDFVLVSGQRALVIRFDNIATASGTINLQDSSAFSNSTLQNTFAFGLSGIDANSGPFAGAGNFTGNNSGGISGIADFNDSGSVATNLTVSGISSIGGSNGRGSIMLTTASGTFNFAVYVVNSSHLLLLEIDTTPVLAGEAFGQSGTTSNASLSGPFAFTVAGASSGPYAAAGTFTTDGNGLVTSGTLDVNNSGTVSIAGNGRGTLTLSSSAGTSNFAVYPSSGGLQMVETDSSIVSSGMAFAQQGAPFSNASIQGGYGLNLSGVSSNGEFDSIGQLSADGNGNFSGTEDFNNTGFRSFGLALSGTYSIGANGRGTGRIQSSAASRSVAYYVVNSSRVLTIELDATVISTGSLEHQ